MKACMRWRRRLLHQDIRSRTFQQRRRRIDMREPAKRVLDTLVQMYEQWQEQNPARAPAACRAVEMGRDAARSGAEHQPQRDAPPAGNLIKVQDAQPDGNEWAERRITSKSHQLRRPAVSLFKRSCRFIWAMRNQITSVRPPPRRLRWKTKPTTITGR